MVRLAGTPIWLNSLTSIGFISSYHIFESLLRTIERLAASIVWWVIVDSRSLKGGWLQATSAIEASAESS
jgi:hypothetical protein